MDALLLLVSSESAAVLYSLYADARFATQSGSVGVSLAAAFFFIVIGRSQGLYRFQALIAPKRHLAQIALALAISLFLLTFMMFVLKTGAEYSRATIVAFAVIAPVLILAGRMAFAGAARAGIQAGVIRGRPVVALGDSSEMESLSPADLLRFGVDEIARIALVGGAVGGGLSQSDGQRVAQAVQTARELRADEFALHMPWSRDRELAEMSRMLRVSPLPVRLYADRKIRAVIRQQQGRGLDPYFSVKLQREPLNRWERGLKRTMDVVLGLAALIVLSPLILIAAVLTKLDRRGPVIFRQRRTGFDSREAKPGDRTDVVSAQRRQVDAGGGVGPVNR